MDELRKHKKSDTCKWVLTLIAFILIGITLVGVILGWFSPKNNIPENTTNETEQTQPVNNSSGYATKFVSTKNVKLMALTPMRAAANNSYAEQTLEATVLPATATNKAVDWSVAWAETQSGNVTDYVTVTPSSSGSTTASVKCYQPFTGNIVVTVTTRESGYSAECIVTFVGIPTEISVSGPFNENSDGYYYMGVGDTYAYTIDLNNIFGTVGVDYQDVNVTYDATGSVVLGTYEYYSQSGNSLWYDTSFNTVSLSSLKDNFMSVSHSGNTISISTIKTIESYYESMKRMDGGRTRHYENKFKEYASDNAYLYIKIEQPDTGLSKIMKIKFDTSVVTGVNTNKAQILF